MNALKLKIKNLKAQSKKTKLEVNDPLSENHSTNGNIAEQDMNEEDEEYDQDNSDVDTKPIINNKVRKRCKKFTKEECELLYKLYEQYCVNLDSSSTPNSVKKRNEAWDNLTTAFNQQQKSGVLRECNELKIKVKNLKASRVKIEPDSDRVNNSQSYIESDTSASKGVVVQEKSMITARPTRSLQTIPAEPKNYSEIAHSTAAVNDLYYEEDFEDDVSFRIFVNRKHILDIFFYFSSINQQKHQHQPRTRNWRKYVEKISSCTMLSFAKKNDSSSFKYHWPKEISVDSYKNYGMYIRCTTKLENEFYLQELNANLALLLTNVTFHTNLSIK